MRREEAWAMPEATSGGDAAPRWERPKTNARAFLLADLAIISFVGGLFVAQPLIFVSIPLTMLLGFTVVRSRNQSPDLEVERTTERVRIREGETTRVRVRVRNAGPRAVALLQVRDRVPPELRGKNTRAGSPPL